MSGLEYVCVNNGDFTVLVSGGIRHHWVSMCTACLIQKTEWVEQRICNIFCLKLEHSSAETIWMIQKAAVVGNWCLAASSRQYVRSSIMCHAEYFGETSNHPGFPLSPDLVPCDFWLFPKLKSPMKGNRFQTINEIQENMSGQLIVIGRTVWGPKVPTLKGTEVSLLYVQCFLYLVSLINISIFHITWPILPGQTLYTCIT